MTYQTLRPIPLAGGSLFVKDGARGFADPQYELLAQKLIAFGETALDLNPGVGVVTMALAQLGLNVTAFETSKAAQLCLEATFGSSVGLQVAPPWQTQSDSADLVAMVLPANRGTRYVEASLWGASNALKMGGRLWISGAKDKGFEHYFKTAQELLGYGILIAKNGANRVAVLEKERPTPPLPNLWESYTTHIYSQPYTFHSLPGVFSASHLDPGTQMLLQALPDNLGQVLDIGAGYGALSIPLGEKSSSITMLDDDLISILSIQKTLESLPSSPLTSSGQSRLSLATILHSDVDSSLTDQDKFTTVVSNPPFHVGGIVVLETATAFLQAAYARLERGGNFFLVANRFLPYEPLLEERFSEVRTLAVGSHKVLQATK